MESIVRHGHARMLSERRNVAHDRRACANAFGLGRMNARLSRKTPTQPTRG